MRRIVSALCMMLALSACHTESAPAKTAPPPQEPAPTTQPAPAPPEPAPSEPASGHGDREGTYQASQPRMQQDGSAVYGGELDPELPLTPLGDILARPAKYANQRVKTQGKIKRVCQKMGCWMEIAAAEAGPEVRAPMAGHSYFLPQGVIGKQAVVEAVVHVKALSQAEKQHYEAEGAKATDLDVSLEAAAVAVR